MIPESGPSYERHLELHTTWVIYWVIQVLYNPAHVGSYVLHVI